MMRGGWRNIPESGAGTDRHQVTRLTNGTTYLFQVRARNGDARGPASAEVAATPAASGVVPEAPQVTAQAGDGQATLSWQVSDPSILVERWQIQQASGSGAYGAWVPIAGSTHETRSPRRHRAHQRNRLRLPPARRQCARAGRRVDGGEGDSGRDPRQAHRPAGDAPRHPRHPLLGRSGGRLHRPVAVRAHRRRRHRGLGWTFPRMRKAWSMRSRG